MSAISRRQLVIALCAALPPSACARAATSRRTLVVFAASSLREVFEALSRSIEGLQAPLQIRFNFAGSQELKNQLLHGARADVVAVADAQHMADLVQAGVAMAPIPFATNELALVVAKESGSRVRELQDLLRVSRLVIGAAEAPIGRYTRAMLDRAAVELRLPDFRARVESKVVSRELNARQVLAKVVLGEADAGFVYKTDARSAGGRVHAVRIPESINVLASYPVATITGSPNILDARAWIASLRSTEGLRLLQQAGFRIPLEARSP